MAYQRDMNAYAYRTRDDTPYDPRAPGPSDEHASYSRNYGPPRLTVAEKEERNARNKELKKYEEPNQTLFIRNLGIGTAEQTVLDAFGKYGDIMKTVNMLDKKGHAKRQSMFPSPANCPPLRLALLICSIYFFTLLGAGEVIKSRTQPNIASAWLS